MRLVDVGLPHLFWGQFQVAAKPACPNVLFPLTESICPLSGIATFVWRCGDAKELLDEVKATCGQQLGREMFHISAHIVCSDYDMFNVGNHGYACVDAATKNASL